MSVGRNSKFRPLLRKAIEPPEPPPRLQLQKKSKKNAYLLLLGQSEAGKSTTLNTLFGGREISPVERDTGTQEVIEFSAELSSGEMHVIDTPGLGDVNGLEWDSQILATIESFRNSHKELQTCVPNIVLIVARFDDNRIEGDLSSFVKMLKSINYQRSNYLDSAHNNLIILLTRFMNGNKTLRANPQARIEMVQNLVKTYTNFVHPPIILLGENEADDWDLKEANLVGQNGDGPAAAAAEENYREGQLISYLLSTGDSYPQNLIDSILRICQESKDFIGEKIFQETFTQPKTLQLKKVQEVKVRDTSREMAQVTLAKLTNIYFTTRSSEMFSKLNDTWTGMGRSTTEPCYEALLINLEKFRYRDFDQLPVEQDLINEFLIKLKPDFDEGLFQLIEKILNLKPSRLTTITKKDVGCGFNIGYDGFTESSVLTFPISSYKTTALIYRLPNEIIKFQPIGINEEKEKVVFHLFNSREEYWSARLRDFCLKPSQKVVTEGKLKMGYNILRKDEPTKPSPPPRPVRRRNKPLFGGLTKSSSVEQTMSSQTTQDTLGPPSVSSQQPKMTTITIAKEFRIGKLFLQEDNSRLEPFFEPNFHSRVTKLKSFNASTRSSMNDWRNFFHTFGTHVVKSAFVGGVIEITVDQQKLIQRIFKNSKGGGKELNQLLLSTYETELRQELELLFNFESTKCCFGEDDDGLVVKMEVKGGNKLLLSLAEKFFKLQPHEKLQYFNKWIESVHEFPTILDRNVQLIEMKSFVEIIVGTCNETKPFLDSFDTALETLYFIIPKKDRSWKLCNFL